MKYAITSGFFGMIVITFALAATFAPMFTLCTLGIVIFTFLCFAISYGIINLRQLGRDSL